MIQSDFYLILPRFYLIRLYPFLLVDYITKHLGTQNLSLNGGRWRSVTNNFLSENFRDPASSASFLGMTAAFDSSREQSSLLAHRPNDTEKAW
jgi:hypothetical protein